MYSQPMILSMWSSDTSRELNQPRISQCTPRVWSEFISCWPILYILTDLVPLGTQRRAKSVKSESGFTPTVLYANLQSQNILTGDWKNVKRAGPSIIVCFKQQFICYELVFFSLVTLSLQLTLTVNFLILLWSVNVDHISLFLFSPVTELQYSARKCYVCLIHAIKSMWKCDKCEICTTVRVLTRKSAIF